MKSGKEAAFEKRSSEGQTFCKCIVASFTNVFHMHHNNHQHRAEEPKFMSLSRMVFDLICGAAKT